MRESKIQTAMRKHLEREEAAGRLIFIKNNTGAIRIKRKGGKSSFIRFGKTGSPDFLIWKRCVEDTKFPKATIRTSYLRTFFVEVKNETGEQSEGQRKFEEMVQNLHGDYFIVRDLNELKEILL